jgi:hypothetical protein
VSISIEGTGYAGPVVAGNIDGDSFTDLCSVTTDRIVRILTGNGDLTYDWGQAFLLDDAYLASLADLEADGDIDLVLSCPDGIRSVYNQSDVITDVDDQPSTGVLPDLFFLHQNYPNPFNPSTIIEYSLPKASNVRLTIYNILGQEVRSLVNEQQSPGDYSINWDARDSRRQPVATGVYLYRLVAGDISQTRKMLLLK